MGISAIITGIVSAVSAVGAEVSTAAAIFGAESATALGLSTGIGEALGTAIGGAVIGGGIGAAEAAVTGGDVLKGFEFGSITGGIGSSVTSGLESLGLPGRFAGVLGDAAGGALGSVATGRNPLTGALIGGAAGYLTGAGSQNPFATAPAATPGGGAASAAATAPPASVAGAGDPGPVGAGGGGGLTLTPPSGASLNPDANGFASFQPPSSAVSSVAGTDFTSGLMAPNAVGGSLPGDFGSGAASGASSTGTAGLSSPASGGAGGATSSTANLTTNPVTPAAATANKGGLLGSVSKNPLMAVELGALGLAAARGQGTYPAEGYLNAQAGQLAAQGGRMEGYLTSGTLPPGLQGTLTSASASAEAAIRSQYASRGMSGSSAESQDISAERARVASEGSQLAIQLFQQGLNETSMADSIYQNLLQQEMQRDQQLGASIGAFAQSLALMGQPVTAGA